MIRLFDLQNGQVIPTEHCYTIAYLKDIMDEYPEDYLSIYAFLFYMTCPNEDLNPYFNIKEEDKESVILQDIRANFTTEDPLVITALTNIKELFETPTSRAFRGIKIALDEYEKNYLEDDVNLKNTYLIYLYADPEFLNDLEDGNSFSNTIEEKQRELFAFEEAVEFSIIPNKLKIKVCDENQEFYSKEHILNQVIEFICT